MNLNQKIKVLWCDRNVHTAHFVDLLANFNYLEISTFESPLDAIEAFKKDPSYKLIISGNLFHTMDGLEFYNRLQITGQSPQFLLFTNDEISGIDSFLLLDNFKYFRKAIYSPIVFEKMVEELIHKSIGNTDANLKMAAIRKSLMLSTAQFAALFKVSSDLVEKYENSPEVPSCYVVMVCRHFDIPLNFFSTVDLEYFKQRLLESSKSQVKGYLENGH
ncbi:MAG: hypothetical protein AB7I27_02195 [Bacteriovoracaceae bacterium]